MSLFEFYLNTYNSDTLRDLLNLCGGSNRITRKQDRAAFLAQTMTSASEVRRLWQKMDTLSQKAVAAAYHNEGVFDSDAFIAQYGSLPPRPRPKYNWSWQEQYILFDLFVAQGRIHAEVMPLLEGLAPPPERFQISGVAEDPPPPVRHKQILPTQKALREEAGHRDLLTFLGLLARGELKLSNSSLRLTPKSVATLLPRLAAGDFDMSAEKADETIICFGLTTFAYQAGLIDKGGEVLPLGRQYLATEDPALLLQAVENWCEADAFDEITRISAIRGLRARGVRFTPLSERRSKIVEALSWCPTGVWISVSDFLRGLKIWHFDFPIESEGSQHLYVGFSDYSRYGSWAPSPDMWLLTTGLYTMAVLWETLASIGALDIIYTDYQMGTLSVEVYGYDEVCFSAYDGLLHFRITPLGAFLFGQADAYTPAGAADPALFSLSPAGRLTILQPQALTVAHQVQLEQIADPVGDGYQLSAAKLLQALEASPTLETQRVFLEQRHRGPLPAEIVALFDRVEADSKALTIQAKSLTIRVRSAEIAQKVLDDPVAGKIARRLDDRTLIIPASRERAFRQALHQVGYGLA